MELKKLVTLTFDKNVGMVDRGVRLASGAALTGAGWYLGLPLWASAAMSFLGVAWTATGVLSKCSIYYLMGYSTCPVSNEVSPFRKPGA